MRRKTTGRIQKAEKQVQVPVGRAGKAENPGKTEKQRSKEAGKAKKQKSREAKKQGTQRSKQAEKPRSRA